jgi:transposase
VLAVLGRLWPGAVINVQAFQKAHPTLPLPQPLVRSQPLGRRVVRVLLEQRPNPYAWHGQSVDDIRRFFQAHGLRCGPATATRVAAVVQDALLLPADLAQVLTERLQRSYARFLQSEQVLQALHQQGVDLLPHSPGQVLLSVPGVYPLLAAQYTAYVGDGQRFTHADQLWAWAGYDVLQSDSGDRRHTGHITRRGETGLRAVLYTLGVKTSQACAEIAQARQRALQHGKGPVGAMLHAAHKANRICFALLTRQVPYTPRASPGEGKGNATNMRMSQS